MSDDPKIIAPRDRLEINKNQAHEMTYWTKALGVTEKQLLAAIEAVGPMVAKIKRHLGIKET